jgi:type VI secretion system secreted protein VgrG
MAQFVSTSIQVENTPIRQFSSLTLSQHLAEHHSFKLVCPSEAIDGSRNAVFHLSKEWIGARITIQISNMGGQDVLQFFGLITQVEAARYSGHSGDLIIHGFSPTILLDNGPHCQSWEKKNLKEIVDDVLKPYPKNLLQTQLQPLYKDKISYTVQYKESAWGFMQRMSNSYGEWLYYDGEKLIWDAEKDANHTLIYGKNLHSFNMAMQVKPAKFQWTAYDYLNHEVYRDQPSDIISKAGLSDWGKHALQKSEAFYTSPPKQWHHHFLSSKNELKERVNTAAAMESGNLIQVKGTSSHPGVSLGSVIKTMGRNVFSLADEAFGEYTPISITHHCDGQGNYTNEFTGIPASVKHPPKTYFGVPSCETQSAMVTDNHDEKGLGRVRVRFHWMEGNEKSPWLRVTTPHAGEGKGIFLMPEVGEEVMVGFEGSCPTKPYVMGSVYHGKAKCTFSNGGNDVKAFQSKSGNKLVLNDKEESVLLSDAKENNLKIDGEGNIVITASASIKLCCGEAVIELSKDGEVKITGKKSVELLSDEKVAAEANELDFNGNQEVKVKGGAKIALESKEIENSAEMAFNVSGKMVKVEGAMTTDIKGGMVNLNC